MDDDIGMAILVSGQVVAWFRDFDEAARDWCAENYFGNWLGWRAIQPTVIPLTAQEAEESARLAEEWAKLFRPHESP